MQTDWSQVAAQISRSTGEVCQLEGVKAVGGGCINSAFLLE